MSYKQAMKWAKKHPKGISHNYMGFAASSSFWPAQAWLEQDWWPYLKKCKQQGIEPIGQEAYYKSSLYM